MSYMDYINIKNWRDAELWRDYSTGSTTTYIIKCTINGKKVELTRYFHPMYLKSSYSYSMSIDEKYVADSHKFFKKKWIFGKSPAERIFKKLYKEIRKRIEEKDLSESEKLFQ